MHDPKRPRIRIADARGRWGRQLDPVGMHLLGRSGIIPAPVLRVIAEEIEPRLARWGRLKVLSCVLAVGTFFVLHAFGATAPIGPEARASAGGVVSAAFASAIPFFLVYLSYQRLHQASFPRIAPVMLKHRRCPHCGCDLRHLKIDPEDGCTVCPGCGSAWCIDDATIAARLAALAEPTPATAELGGWSMVGSTSGLFVVTLVGLITFVLAR